MVNVRIAHSPSHIILKFDVAECEFRIAETEQPASVWEDSCVEFFFRPDTGLPFLLPLKAPVCAFPGKERTLRAVFRRVGGEGGADGRAAV